MVAMDRRLFACGGLPCDVLREQSAAHTLAVRDACRGAAAFLRLQRWCILNLGCTNTPPLYLRASVGDTAGAGNGTAVSAQSPHSRQGSKAEP